MVRAIGGNVFRAAPDHYRQFRFVIDLFARGRTTGSPGAFTALENFENTTGFFGIGILLSAAWSL